MPEQTPPETTEATGYAVYDKTLLRFISGVGTKADAEKAKRSGPDSHSLEVRKV